MRQIAFTGLRVLAVAVGAQRVGAASAAHRPLALVVELVALALVLRIAARWTHDAAGTLRLGALLGVATVALGLASGPALAGITMLASLWAIVIGAMGYIEARLSPAPVLPRAIAR